MSAPVTCPECGAPVRNPQTPCPACLIKIAFREASATDASSGDPRLAATLERTPHATSRPQLERPLPVPGELFGDYRLLRMLGKGGMGAVYEAEDLNSCRRVALKVLKHSLDSPEARKRFLRE